MLIQKGDEMNRKALLTLFALLLTATLARGQAISGEITGVVTDSSKAVVVSARLTATNVDTGGTLIAESNASGIYRLSPLPVGTYKLTAQKEGFSPFVANQIVVNTASVLRVDVGLAVAGTAQTLEVTSVSPLLLSETVTDSQVVNNAAVENLPLQVNGRFRDPVALTALTPGVTGAGYGGIGTFANNTNNYPVISGGRGYEEEVMIDGSPNTGYPNSQASDADQPQLDAIAEFKVILSIPSAEYGRTTGGVITMTTKSGTRQLHGGASELLRNDFFDARPFFAAARARVRQDEFGAYLGGPVYIPKIYTKPDKTFFFFDYNAFRQSVHNTGNIKTVPTDPMRAGNFSAWPKIVYDPLTNAPDGNGGITRLPFSGNIIPINRLDPVALQIQALYPHANLPGVVNNYNGTQILSESVNAYFAKIDHNFTDNNRLSASYRYKADLTQNQGILGLALDGTGYPPPPVSQNLNITDDHIISSSFLNHFTLGFVRIRLIGQPGGTNPPTITVPGTFGPGRPDPCFTDTYTYNVGSNQCGFSTFYRMEGHYDMDVTDNLTKYVGKHAFKWGGRIGRYGFNQRPTASLSGTAAPNAACWQCAGTYTFSSLGTSLPDAANRGNSGNAWASMLLGFTDTGSAQQYPGRGWRTQYYSLFIQDDYKITSRLTLNYGLRWELDIPFYEVEGRNIEFNLTTPNPGAGGLPGATVYYGSGPGRVGTPHFDSPNYKEFGPRLGLAYQVAKNTVVRAGAAILWAPFRFIDTLQIPIKNGFDNNAFATTLNQSVTPAFYLSQGFPASAITRGIGFGGTANPNLLNGQNAPFTQSSDGRTDQVYQFTFAIQHVLPGKISIDAAYVGTMGNHLSNFTDVNPNQLPVSDLALGNLLNQNIYSAAAAAAGYHAPYGGFQGTVAQSLRPYPQILTLTDYGAAVGHSTYNAFQLKVEKTFASGFQVSSAYSFSKTLTDSDMYGYGLLYVQDTNTYNSKLDKSLSVYDTPQQWVSGVLYELPFGPGKRFATRGGVLGKLTGGWIVSGLTTYRSGLPLYVDAPNTLPIFNGLQTANAVPGVPMTLSTNRESFNPATDRYLNPAGFAIPAPFTIGTLGRVLPNVRAFGTANEDLNLIKRVTIRERVKGELMFSFFNAFNRHGLGFPNVDPTSPAFGKITSAQNPRYGQIGAKILW